MSKKNSDFYLKIWEDFNNTTSIDNWDNIWYPTDYNINHWTLTNFFKDGINET